MIKKLFNFKAITLLATLFFLTFFLCSKAGGSLPAFSEIEEKIEELMDEGKIPGMSIVIVRGEDEVIIRNLGFANLKKKTPVTSDTLFELSSCSKAFASLAALQLAQDGTISLHDPVSKYFPWFDAKYENQKCEITLKQLLHHTSGIPQKTLSLIPQDSSQEALEKIVRKISGVELNNIPGKRFEYASINYDIVGAVIEKASKMTFENYMQKKIFKPLGLTHTTVGQKGKNHPLMAAGYKIGFFSPRRYDSPVFRGNNPAAYVISNAKDIARWIKLQMGLIQSEMRPLFKKSHFPDRMVPPQIDNFSFYAMGWWVSQVGKTEFFHPGKNPNFTSYISFKPGRKIGVAVLANVNTNYANIIGNYVLKTLAGEEVPVNPNIATNMDKAFSLASIGLGIYLLLITIFLMIIIRGIFKKRRRYKALNRQGISLTALAISLIIPVLIAVYLAPQALYGFTWETIVAWAPVSLPAAAVLLLTAVAATFVVFFFSLIFPHRSSLLNSMPFVIILSFISGILNSAAIFIVIQSFSNTMAFKYTVIYFCLTLFLFFSISKTVRKRLVGMTNDLVFDLRMRLIKKMFATNYQRFERLDTGRIYATVNDDTRRIGESPNLIVRTIMNLAIVICIFVYLLTISLVPTIIVLGIIGLVAAIYTIASRRAQVLWEEARDAQNVFMSLVDGLVKGYKELSLRLRKKYEYGKDVENICDTYRQKRTHAFFKFVNLNVLFETVLLVILGFVSIGFPRIFPEIGLYTIIGFVMVLFYVVGPIAAVIGGIPSIMQIRVSWNRIRGFLREIPGIWEPEKMKPLPQKNLSVQKIKTKNLTFEYGQKDKHERFALGPIDIEAKKGEILFIIGGNGSGKTTLAKLLTGLYKPDKGEVIIDSNGFKSKQLGEYFSTVFSNYHLFEKLYDIDVSQKKEEIEKYLKLLELEGKVHLENGSFSTIDLSGGQRKRLALLQCYLEDHPIYLFDEWAADQDPTFRKFFYRDLLLKMKKEGKIVIAITHDDKYFDVADKIIKMDLGKIEILDTKKKKFAG